MAFIPVKEISEQTGLSVTTLSKLAHLRKFTSIRISRRVLLIDVESFKKYIQASTTYAEEPVEVE